MTTEVSTISPFPLERAAQLVLGIDGMVSQRTEQMVEGHLAKLPGVIAKADFPSRSLHLQFDRQQCAMPEIARRLDELGLRIRPGGPLSPNAVRAAHPSLLNRTTKLLLENPQLATAVIGALLLIAGWSVKLSHGPQPLRFTLVAAAFLIAGWYTAIDTFKILFRLQFDIDVLMFAAAIGAAAIENYEEGAFLLVLFAFGGAGESLAMDRARHAIESLAKLAPDTATLRDPDGNERLVPVENLQAGDLVVVRPFDRFPTDGIVQSGASSVDQSPITGESVPVDKLAGSNIFAASINGDGLLIVRVTKLASESTLARIVKMVREAQATKSPTQLFTAKVEKFYVPLVLVATAILIVVPPLLGLHHRQDKGPWAGWFYQAMAFLTGASPCALAIGTPAAILSGIARAARIGVLIKGGVHLENLGRIKVVAFDKTGTITAGRPIVTKIISLDSTPENQMLAYAAAIEKISSHPLAAAIVSEARLRNLDLPPTSQVQQLPGQGMVGTILGHRISVGKAPPSPESSSLTDTGQTVVAVTIDDKLIALIGLLDQPRPNARETINSLKKIGIRRTILLTGDRASIAQTVATEVGVDEFHADLLPEQKLELVRNLQNKYGPIAMIGDGVNDAPALASATVGIAMGGAGTDVAIETADIALMSDDLAKLPDAIELSRFSRKIIQQNLIIALGVIAILAPLSALGFTYLGVAVLFHEGSTLVVVLNSLRLLVHRRA